MLYHCKVIDKNEQDKEKLCVCELDLMGILMYNHHSIDSIILKDEIYSMQTKFDKYLCIIDVDDIDYRKMFKNHLPYYKEGMFVHLDHGYADNDKTYMEVVYSSEYPHLAFMYSDVRDKYNYRPSEVENMPLRMYADHKYELTLTKKIYSKYKFVRKTLGLYYVNLNVVHFDSYNNKCFKQDTPAWVTKLKFITDNFYLYELLNYIRKNTKLYKYINKLLSDGGIKENEFIHFHH